MARRKPGLSPAEAADASPVPAWVRQVGYGHIIRDAGQGLRIDDVHAEHLRRVEAARQWCVEHGLSYSMTVHDWRHPSPHEVAAGLTKGPADLDEPPRSAGGRPSQIGACGG